MTSRFDSAYKATLDDDLTPDFFNKRFRDVDSRLTEAEVQRLSEDEAFQIVLDRVLTRSEEVISSLRDRLVALTDLQWLTATSESTRTLEVGQNIPFQLIEEDQELFVPGPFAVLTWTGGDPDHYAVVRNIAYDQSVGIWTAKVESFVGDPGPWSTWEIAAVAGSTLAQMALLGQGQTLAQAVAADRYDVALKLASVTALAEHVEEVAADVAAMAGDVGGASGFDGRLDALETTAASLVPRASGGKATVPMIVAGTDDDHHVTSKGLVDSLARVVAAVGGSWAPDCSNSKFFDLTLTSNLTLEPPSAAVDGASFLARITQPHVGGPCTMVRNAAVKKGVDLNLTLSTSADAVDWIAGIIVGTTLEITGFTRGVS